MNEFSRLERLMGSQFELRILCEKESRANDLLNEAVQEIQRIEKLLTEFDENSFTSHINRSAGVKSVEVPDEVHALIERSLRISKLTQGAFDITSGALKKLYKFKNREFIFPGKNKIAAALDKVGYGYIRLQKNREVYLEKKDMHISFAAIGKGYAADCAAKLLQDKHVVSGVINASGDLTVWGKKNDGQPWKVGIANPDNPSEILCWIPLNDASVATSGDYYQHFVYEGKKYSHNINPKSGLPLTGVKSVTVIGRSAELCDALATACYVMGKSGAMHFINQLPDVHCIIIDDNNEVFFSKNLNRKNYLFNRQPQYE